MITLFLSQGDFYATAKHHILEACFFRMTPFRSMLLTLQSGLQRLTPTAQSVPAYAQVFRHSSIKLARRTRISWWRVSILRHPLEIGRGYPQAQVQGGVADRSEFCPAATP